MNGLEAATTGPGESLVALLTRGGPVVGVLVALSLLAMTIALVKLYQFARARIWSRAWLEPALEAARRGELERAVGEARSRPGSLARVVETALGGRLESADEDLLREEVERVGNAELAALGSNLRGLETIGNLAPLLGLLGTVLGMIRAFIRLEEASGNPDPALLAGGIWEALLTTAVGLIVAIPTQVALSWLESQVERVRRRLGDAATRALAVRAPGATEQDEAGVRRVV